ncbi:hypothetical protein F4604DRAFT_1926954 [Suillus subluteus]|nr:hypothetical protein F4604DRAFT_1926954 [Suillus subluteus]
MSAAVLDLIDIYDGEGAVILIQHHNGGKPAFDVKTSAEVLASPGSVSGLQPSRSVLVAINGLYNNAVMLASMVRSIANDIAVECVYAESVELANFLVTEARKQGNEPYMSAEALMMEGISRRNGA